MEFYLLIKKVKEEELYKLPHGNTSEYQINDDFN